jgi:hypothetical protein
LVPDAQLVSKVRQVDVGNAKAKTGQEIGDGEEKEHRIFEQSHVMCCLMTAACYAFAFDVIRLFIFFSRGWQ